MSNAVHPCRSVASKNGERRYQGPKYSVVDVGVVVVVAHRDPPVSRPEANILNRRSNFREAPLAPGAGSWLDCVPTMRDLDPTRGRRGSRRVDRRGRRRRARPRGAGRELRAPEPPGAGSTRRRRVRRCWSGARASGTSWSRKNLTIKGSPAATLDGNQAGHTVLISGTHTVHLRTSRSRAAWRATGGGIQASAGKLFLVHVTVEDDYAIGTTAEGGGIFFGNGTLSLASSTIRNDVAAASSSDAASATGGGILIEKGTLTITGSTIRDNSVVATSDAGDANATGGGIDVTAGADHPHRLVPRRRQPRAATAAGGAQAEFAGHVPLRRTDPLALYGDRERRDRPVHRPGGSSTRGGRRVLGGSLSQPNARLVLPGERQPGPGAGRARVRLGAGTAGSSSSATCTVTSSSVSGNRATATGSTSPARTPAASGEPARA